MKLLDKMNDALDVLEKKSQVRFPAWDIRDLQPLPGPAIYELPTRPHLDTTIEEKRARIGRWFEDHSGTIHYSPKNRFFNWINLRFADPTAALSVLCTWLVMGGILYYFIK